MYIGNCVRDLINQLVESSSEFCLGSPSLNVFDQDEVFLNVVILKVVGDAKITR